MYKHLIIDTSQNKLLCSNNLVGIGELVEVHELDDASPRQAFGRTLRKLKDPNHFAVYSSHDCDDKPPVPLVYELGERCVFRVVAKNRSGTLRRKWSKDEKAIVNIEHDVNYIEHENKVVKAKTGSVRKKH